MTGFAIRSRKQLETIESKILAPYARRSCDAHATRLHEEPEHAYRTAFQRDRDRIIHSRAFRRLKHKRQVFLTTDSDHYRTRMTHTLEVSQLSTTIARALGLNTDLVEAIALGHDIGHTPFGHLGEEVLNDIMTGKRSLHGQGRAMNLGGFKHNYQSVRIADHLEKKYLFDGLNLTAAVREGILKHTGLRRKSIDYPDFQYRGLCTEQNMSTTLEGQVVAICDEIAQRTHDLQDGVRAGLVDMEEVRELAIIKQIETVGELGDLRRTRPEQYQEAVIRALINLLIDDVIAVTLANLSRRAGEHREMAGFDEELVHFSAEMHPLQQALNSFIYKKIIHFSRVRWSDELAGKLIFRLFEAYFLDPALLPDYLLAHYFGCDAADAAGRVAQLHARMQEDGRFFRLVCDYIAGMTDHFALREGERLAQLNKITIDDLHLQTALSSQPKSL